MGFVISLVKKRNGELVLYDRNKIANAVYRAFVETHEVENPKEVSEKIAEEVEKRLIKERLYVPEVEQIQDIVEKTLMDLGYFKTARAYIIYREERKKIREAKKMLGVKDDLKLSLNAIKVLEKRYLLKDDKGKVIETPRQMFWRVARYVGLIDIFYCEEVYDISGKSEPQIFKNEFPHTKIDLSPYEKEMLIRAYNNLAKEGHMKVGFEEVVKLLEEKWDEILEVIREFNSLMVNRYFIPNSPTLMNANTRLGQLSACFVLPVEDSIDGIYKSLWHAAKIHQSGGGTGFSFTRLRPEGDLVGSTKGVASGPVSFMRIYDVSTDIIKQGGKRRGANMGILSIHHPDIEKFILSKDPNNKVLSNFNISVAVTDEFMEALENDEEYPLINPRNNQVVRYVPARKIWDMIVHQAWATGDPGLIFIDEINRKNPTPHLGKIESTNPCVTGDTLISTEFGLMKMEDLVEKYSNGGVKIATDNRVPIQINDGRNVYLMQKSQKGISFNSITKAFCTGVKDVYKLVTESGYELKATPDHKILTTEGWVELKNIDPEKHKVLIQSGEGKFNDNYELPFKVKNKIKGKNGRIYEFNLPQKWSKELGQVIGYLVGNGWIREGKDCRVGFTFGKDNIEILNYLKQIINNFYGREIKEVKRSNGVFHLSYHSKYFVDFFKKLGVTFAKDEEKRVPASIFTAPKEAVIGFLQGLFSADGTVGINESSKNYYIRLTSKSEKLLKDVQLLLLNLGIKSKIYDRSRESRNSFSYKTKGGVIKTYKSDGKLFELNISRESLRKFIEEIGFLANKHKEKIDKIKKLGINFYSTKFEEKIKEIKYIGKRKVYDLTEPKTLSFIANGIISLDCGEQPLLPYESCNLGSINLSLMVENGEILWDRLRRVVHTAVHFLDNVIDANKFPISEIEYWTRKNRKIGLGVMGWAEMLIKLGIPYDSMEAVELAEKVMKFIQEESHRASELLAEKRGTFPAWEGSVWWEKGRKMRNATTTTIAPTGTISIIAGTSSGIEPLFAIAFQRRVLEGETLLEINPLFEKIIKERGLYSKELMYKVARTGSVQGIEEIPEDIRKIFVTAHDVDPKWHLLMQAAFQKYTDNAVSKTINLRHDVPVEVVDEIFKMAYRLKLKGITIYRDKSKRVQVIYRGVSDEKLKEMEMAEKKLREEREEKIQLKLVDDKYLTLEEGEESSCPKGTCDD